MTHPRALLEAFGLRPRKSLGQTFLTDRAAAHRIARSVMEGSPPGEPFRVLEIGPGTGALSEALLEAGADLTSVDVDANMIAILAKRAETAAAKLVHADALHYDYTGFAAHGPWVATGNLPYNIATPLMLQLIGMDAGPRQIVVMIQKDVAERLAASPSTRAYGSLTLAVQYAMEVERLFTLAPSSFYPRPKVHSTVVRLTRRSEPAVRVADPARLRQVVRGAFAYRRKTLANSLHLSLGLNRSAVVDVLVASGLEAETRGEQLDLSQFAALTARL